ncbi:MAG: hypothetical protein AABY07_07165, partial [Nanoarchaeota archaeon]
QDIIAKVGKRLGKLQDEENINRAIKDISNVQTPEAFNINLPNIEQIRDLTPEQQESQIANYFDQQAEIYSTGDDRPIHPLDEKVPQVKIGDHIEPLKLESREDLVQAVQHVKQYWEKRKTAELQASGIKKVPLTPAYASTIADLRESIQASNIEITMDELEQKTEENYQTWIRDNTALAFYDAVAEFWNDDISLTNRLNDKDKSDLGMKFHIDSGAATALTALSKDYLGLKLDTLKLIQGGNIELAAASLAYHVYNKQGMTNQEYSSIVNKVKQFNTYNQENTEKIALDRHAKLNSQYKEIQRQKEAGELLDKVRISTLEMNSLLEQRTNLGSALGSLQASATFLDQLERLPKQKDDVISVNFGGNKNAAESFIDRFKLTKKASLDNSDPDNLAVKVGLSSLDKTVSEEKDLQAQFDEYEKIKTDMSGTTEDELGNLTVDKYDVPFWKKEFVPEGGDTPQEYKWRVEQRNDINWL